MHAATALRTLSPVKQLTLTALFAALCYVGTAVVQIPAPSGGYLNIGDAFVLLAGWCLGPVFGSVAAATGSALADLIAYPIYAPATFIIKGLDALAAYGIWFLLKKSIKKDALDFLPRTIAALAGETVMVFGYAIFESFLGGPAMAIVNMPFNLIQAAVCAMGAVAFILPLRKLKSVKRIFPLL